VHVKKHWNIRINIDKTDIGAADIENEDQDEHHCPGKQAQAGERIRLPVWKIRWRRWLKTRRAEKNWLSLWRVEAVKQDMEIKGH